MSLQASGKGASSICINHSGNKFTAANVKGALNELFTSANDGKNAVANSVTTKGASSSYTDAFSALATKIGQIQSVFTGNLAAVDLLVGKTDIPVIH